jgi:hypothetical protein
LFRKPLDLAPDLVSLRQFGNIVINDRRMRGCDPGAECVIPTVALAARPKSCQKAYPPRFIA